MRPAILLLVALAACSSAGGGAGLPPGSITANTEPRRVSGRNIEVGRDGSDDRAAITVNAPIADVWRVLPAVLDSLGVPVTMSNPQTMEMGNAGYEVRRTMGGTMVSRYFRCGDQSGGSSAMSYDLFVSLVTRLAADGPTRTTLTTSLPVRGKPITYSSDWIRCESVGLLEQRIADGVSARLRG